LILILILNLNLILNLIFEFDFDSFISFFFKNSGEKSRAQSKRLNQTNQWCHSRAMAQLTTNKATKPAALNMLPLLLHEESKKQQQQKEDTKSLRSNKQQLN
jgi:hypothetical protein